MTETRTVRLGDLEHDPVAIDGQEARLGNLDDLKASIPAAGLNQSLKVRPWVPGTKRPTLGKRGRPKATEGEPLYGVVAGNRRLATLRWLLAEGGSIRGEPVTADWPVPVMIEDDDDARVREVSAAENLMRLPPTPVEEFRLFHKMAETQGSKEIAAHFGIPQKRVEQRLKLAALHPDVLQALADDKISMEAAQAFTLESDPKRQAEYLRKHKGWELQAHSIKQAFTNELIRSDSPIAKLIGKKAYVAAGGEVIEDAFNNTAYWISPEVVNRLAAEKNADQVAAWREDGWLFVETVDEFGKDQSGGLKVYAARRLQAEPASLTPELAAEADGLRKRQAELEAAHPSLGPDWDPWDGLGDDVDELPPEREKPEVPEAAQEEYDANEARLEAIEAGVTRAFSADQKALSGVVYWPDGSREPVLGVVKPGTKVPGESDSGAAGAGKPAATLDDPGPTVASSLNEQMTKALQRKVSADALMALRITVATLHGDIYRVGSQPSVQLDARVVSSPKVEGELPMGRSFASALAWAAEQDVPALLMHLAQLVAMVIDLRGVSGTRSESNTRLVDFVDPATAGGFDAAAYFGGITKPLIALAWAEMQPELQRQRGQARLAGDKLDEVPPFNSSGKKADMAAAAAVAAKLTGWLPPQLRTRSYTGPGAKAAAPANDAEPDAQLQAAE